MPRTILLAAMQSGDHVQVGPAFTNHDDAYRTFERFDSDLSGYHRDDAGRLRIGKGRPHAIQGEPVRFYRLRDEKSAPIEFAGRLRKVRKTGVRRTGFVGMKASR